MQWLCWGCYRFVWQPPPVKAADDSQDQALAQDVVLEKLIVTDKFPSVQNLGTSEMEADILESKRAAVSDTAKLLEDTPGVSRWCVQFTGDPRFER